MTPHSTPVHAAIDRAYASFVQHLPPSLAAIADDLPFRLGMTPNHGTPWSRVFNNAAVLGFPMLLLADTGRVPREIRDRALAAHVLAIVGAFGMDRIDDGQIDLGLGEREVIDRVRLARDRVLAPLSARAPGFELDYAAGERLTAESVDEERATAARGTGTTFDWYRAVSWKKQGLAFPACLAAAAAAGLSAEDQRRVEAVVEGAALGLQYRDNVVDWMDDLERGFAWAHALLRRAPAAPASVAEVQDRLHAEGTLVRMLEMSSAAFAEAAENAAALGAEALAAWAAGQAELTAGLAEREAASPGFAVRWERDRKAQRERGQATSAARAA